MTVRVAIGFSVWAGVLALLGIITIPSDGVAHRPAAKLLEYAAGSPRTLVVSFPAGTELQRRDPVFVVDDVRYLDSVGLVRDVRSEKGRTVAILTVFPEQEDVLREGLAATAFTAPSSAAWVVQTLLPPERVRRIGDLTAEFVRAEGRRVADTLWPQVRLGLLDLLAHYEKALPMALEARAERIRALVTKHRDGVVAEELLPAIEEVVLVRAEERFRPFLEEVGQELWEKLPIWSLGARYVWEGVPGTKEGQLRARFEEYLKNDAMPVLRSRAPEALKIARETLKESLEDPRLRQALKKVAAEVSSDPETVALLKDLAGELILRDERLREVLRRRWDDGLEAAVSAAAARMEPLVRKVVDSIALTEDRQAINPRLARVLRARLLRKDRRWVLLTPGTGAPLEGDARIDGSVGRE